MKIFESKGTNLKTTGTDLKVRKNQFGNSISRAASYLEKAGAVLTDGEKRSLRVENYLTAKEERRWKRYSAEKKQRILRKAERKPSYRRFLREAGEMSEQAGTAGSSGKTGSAVRKNSIWIGQQESADGSQTVGASRAGADRNDRRTVITDGKTSALHENRNDAGTQQAGCAEPTNGEAAGDRTLRLTLIPGSRDSSVTGSAVDSPVSGALSGMSSAAESVNLEMVSRSVRLGIRAVKKTAKEIRSAVSHDDMFRQDPEMTGGAAAAVPFTDHVTESLKKIVTAVGTVFLGAITGIGSAFLSVITAVLAVIAVICMIVSIFVPSASVGTSLTTGGFMPYYNQYDYPDVPYNGGTVRSDGCGLTSFCMVASLMTGESLTPDVVATTVTNDENGNTYAQYNTVTTHSAIPNLAAHYGIEIVEQMGGPNFNCCGNPAFDMDHFKDLVTNWHPMILSLNHGYYCPGSGHYVAVYGTVNGNPVVYDPGSRERYIESTEGNASWDLLVESCKHIWVFAETKPSINLTGGSNTEIVYNALTSDGYSPAAAAGVIGNMYGESSRGMTDLNPSAENASSGAIGICQWLGSRKTNAKNFFETAGDPWPNTSVATQVQFALKELDSGDHNWLWTSISASYGSQYNISYEEWKNTDDPELATMAFLAKFERGYEPQSLTDYKISKAREVYEAFS